MNQLLGSIIAMEQEAGIALVGVLASGGEFTAMLLGTSNGNRGWQPGESVYLLFKETEVSLAKSLSGLLSLRNRHPGTVQGIIRGKLLSRVVLDYQQNTVTSIITTRSVDRLALVPGDVVEWLVKANEMAVERVEP